MTQNILPRPSLTQELQNTGDALRELTVAAGRLTVALWSALWQGSMQVTPALTPHEEASRLRAMADGVAKCQPSFAQDLYAAANRHEAQAIARKI